MTSSHTNARVSVRLPAHVPPGALTPMQVAYRAKQAARELPRGQGPTLLHISIIFLLARWQHHEPPHAKLARAANCHRNSVAAAFKRLRDLGLIDWVSQYRTVRGKRFQIANRYLFKSNLPFPPARAVAPRKGKKDSSLLGPQSLCTGEIRQISPLRTLAQLTDRLLGGRGGPQPPVRTVAEQLAAILAP